MKTLTLMLTLTAALICNRPFAAPSIVKGGDSSFAVIELFTSEGCSSCPPADHLIAQLREADTARQLYILAFHVDYWDHQGWKDRFSQAAWSQRQQAYATWLNRRQIYTPQLIVNGTSEHIGSDANAVTTALSAALAASGDRQLRISAAIDGKFIDISHTNTRNNLQLALVQKDGRSNVRRGENAGSELVHVQIVRELITVRAGETGNVRMRSPQDFDAKTWELIGFVQDAESGRITDAARCTW
ncbi:DUF1223 domain-containing protein [Chitinophaga horti]|uniref:DUF1223 domain-containing protein n=1 Tax=Chitinophaga horti TaxID=2920382 RepID=A0ABY6IWH2_9BACT|nr:DUF1223 domain-containing protein [Chitinophaga horti]UYQ91725.1 DUF1223 domain-containing protein [Chitinophaga horti]